MTEIVVGVATYALRKLCDACGKGEMCLVHPNAMISACGADALYTVRYPEIRHEIGTIDQPLPFAPVWGQRAGDLDRR